MTAVSTAAFYERATGQLSSLRKRAETLQSQIGSGERLVSAADDPAAAAKLRSLARAERFASVDTRNAQRAATDLRLADEALGSVADIVIRARELALQASGSAQTDGALAAIGTEVANLRENLIYLANSRDASGNALFGGETAGQAYALVAGTVTYQGSATAPATDLGDGQAVTRSITGPEFLAFTGAGGPSDLFLALEQLASGLAGGGAGAVAAASAALGELDAGLEQVTTAQTVIGTRQAWIETIDERRVATGELLAEERASVGGADLASTITRLQELLTVLEASQASFVRLSGMSLFNQLR